MKEEKIESIIDKNKKKKRRKERRKIKTSKVIWELLRMTVGNILKKKFHAEGENLDLFQTITPPYFLISNHNSFWGPFLLAFFVPHPVSYVVSDANFRSPLMNVVLGLIGAIPKTKVISDLDTIKYIMEIRHKKGVIGLFPEGQNSYDGHAQPIFYSTAKLIKRSKIPVVFGDKRGSYLSFPRWAKKPRHGKVRVSYHLAFTPESLSNASIQDIYQKLVDLMDYDEFEHQKEVMVPYDGKDRAEYLEILLFVCPNCHSLASLTSKGDEFTCHECGYSVVYNRYCFFENKKGKTFFSTVRDWNVWQLDYIDHLFNKKVQTSPEELLFEETDMEMFVGYKTEPMRKTAEGTLALFCDRIVLRTKYGSDLEFFLEKIQGANMHNEEKLDFYYEDTLFRFSSPKPNISLYKWYNFIQILKTNREAQRQTV